MHVCCVNSINFEYEYEYEYDLRGSIRGGGCQSTIQLAAVVQHNGQRKHIVERCPLTRFTGGLPAVHEDNAPPHPSRIGVLAVWLSGNTLASINVVALRQTRLVLGWVTVCGRVNHLGM